MNSRLRIYAFVENVRRVAGSLSSRSAWQRHQLAQSVRASPLFDEAWYLRTYPDVAAAKVDAASHFAETGWREGRDPGPDFATSAYLQANPDVARSGVNPLLHYIEFGKFEGREIVPRRKQERPAPMPSHRFAWPAPVFRGDIQETRPPAWSRSYRLSPHDDRLLRIEDLPIGLAPGRQDRERIEADFALLRRLSGLDVGVAQADSTKLHSDARHALVDAWHAGGGVLRTRWKVRDYPTIIRAYQHQVSGEGGLVLVAESLAESALDFVDAHLDDPYFPVLFVFADPDNSLQSTRLLAFPSLCRGGLHYAELVTTQSGYNGDWPDPLQVGLERALALTEVRRADTGLIRHIAVEADNSRCSGPLFQPDFQKWLRQVAGIGIVPLPGGAAGSIALSSADNAPGDQSRLRSNGGTLVLAGDMVPTIGAITAVGSEGNNEAGAEDFPPLLVASSDPSKPALLIEIPADVPSSVAASAPGYPIAWPRSSGTSAASGVNVPAAIRFTNEAPLSDAELLIPSMASSPAVEPADDEQVCWAICPCDWSRPELVEALTALSVQQFAGKISIAFAGDTPQDVHDLANRLFDGRVRNHADLPAILGSAGSGFVGYIGPGVILHEPQTTSHFVGTVREPAVSSVSCVLLTAERKGKTSHISIVDAGRIANVEEAGHPVDADHLALHCWRSCYPVKRPPRDLWLARREEARTWRMDNQPLRADGFHVCSTLVTASYSRQRPKGRSAAAPPPALDSNSLVARSFFG